MPKFEKWMEYIQDNISYNLFDLLDKVIAKWWITYRQISDLRQTQFLSNLHKYKEFVKEIWDPTSERQLDQLELLFTNLPDNLLAWTKAVEVNEDAQKKSELATKWIDFLKRLESYNLIYNDSTILNQDRLSWWIEDVFKDVFIVWGIDGIIAKVNYLLDLGIKKWVKVLPWYTIINTFYTKTWRKRPKGTIEQHRVPVNPQDKYINRTMNIGDFLRTLKYPKKDSFYETKQVLWLFKYKKGNDAYFIIWTYSKEPNDFIYLRVPFYINKIEFGTVKKLEINKIEPQKADKVDIEWDVVLE